MNKTPDFKKCRAKLRIIGLCGALATVSVLGQTTRIWTGGDGTGTELGASTNWVTGPPLSVDTLDWNGVAPGNLHLVYDISAYTGNFGFSGFDLYLTANQTGSVQIDTLLTSSPYLAFADIIVDGGAGPFILGGTNAVHLLNLIGRPAGAVHHLTNNSTNPVTINPQVGWSAGGGAAYTLDFSGTGNWYCSNFLVINDGPGLNIQVDGPGTMYWNPAGFLGTDGVNSPIVINGGAIVLLGNHPKLGNQAFTLGGNFEFNAPAQAQTLSGAISGSGQLVVSNGTLTLSGPNTYAGKTVLSGGELIANGVENPGVSGPLGVGGTISFSGGTLGFGANNASDYSPRFDPSANQAYRIDTGVQNVIFAADLNSSGGTLTKLGPGTLTLTGAETYGGLTTVNAGKLVIQGPAGLGNITVADGAVLGVVESGTPLAPGMLTVGTAAGATLEFNNVTSAFSAPLEAGTIAANVPITININSYVFLVGQSYPLLSWISGSAPPVNLGPGSGALGSLSTNGNTIQFNVISTMLIWNGTNGGSWTAPNNWQMSGSPASYVVSMPVLFDDTASGTTSVTVGVPVNPRSVTVINNAKNYSIDSVGGGGIAGVGGLTKLGNGMLALSGGANTYAGGTAINGGIVTLTGNNSYPGGTTIDDGTTLKAGNGRTGGGIGTGALTDNGAFIWNQSGTVTFPDAVTGWGAFAKSGTGTLTLSSANLALTGATTLSNGTLIVTGQVVPGTVQLGGGDVDLEGGTLIPGGVGMVVTNLVAGNLIIDSGTVVFTINTSASPMNTVFSLAVGMVTATGGSLKLINVGPQPTVGRKFTLFSEPVTGGTNLSIVTPGFTVANNLAVDGSVTVTAVAAQPVLSATTASGSNLNLNWPPAWTGGVQLQVQTNSVETGLGTNWVAIPGTDGGSNYSTSINASNGAVFYRLVSPP